MKYIKENESKMKIVNYKDLDTWSVKNNLDSKPYKDVKFDGKLANKVADLFAEYEMGIEINKSEYCYRLPDEENLEEYRITVEKVYTEAMFLEDWSLDDLDEVKEKTPENQDHYDWFMRDFEKIEKINNIFDNSTTFSVFLPKNKLGEGDLTLASYYKASKYLKKLSKSMTEVYTNQIGAYWDAFQNHSRGFKKFLELNDIQINNDNLGMIWDISHRLYKDAKFCYYLKESMDDHDLNYEKFIQDWINLL